MAERGLSVEDIAGHVPVAKTAEITAQVVMPFSPDPWLSVLKKVLGKEE